MGRAFKVGWVNDSGELGLGPCLRVCMAGQRLRSVAKLVAWHVG